MFVKFNKHVVDKLYKYKVATIPRAKKAMAKKLIALHAKMFNGCDVSIAVISKYCPVQTIMRKILSSNI
ncbi:hypothetical protein [Listeria phage LP-KV022]|uniref:Uncharacterized protein n=1 Tax=Listeria phage LP-KV022 TaxID=2178917 RepID=A0A5A4K0V9_9CAUD|nr:hypothetical protein [Listeria phage LP-KV022]